ncbi:hypothetical protein E2562_020161 [Oryza meyeriana var. granulata]|uniref:Bifunctional inhibitor/plant lipid transfer protein/seed storage helical domain-containing protein n=1 Tax=Oryza meyeriana var. granulata TaxID=110450 RepID=A0A6G1BNH6_9ORYZ|nr:hypothetical protein E2562_020161 [Oryza meyeriana var. granulata]
MKLKMMRAMVVATMMVAAAVAIVVTAPRMNMTCEQVKKTATPCIPFLKGTSNFNFTTMTPNEVKGACCNALRDVYGPSVETGTLGIACHCLLTNLHVSGGHLYSIGTQLRAHCKLRQFERPGIKPPSRDNYGYILQL